MAFKLLKRRFTSTPILVHYDSDLPIVVECDASDFAIGAILSQKVNDKLKCTERLVFYLWGAPPYIHDVEVCQDLLSHPPLGSK